MRLANAFCRFVELASVSSSRIADGAPLDDRAQYEILTLDLV
jgi:hypothetical protein